MNGDVSEAELHAAFSEQAQALASGGAQGLIVETMQDLDEARIAIAAAKATGLPVVASMVFDSGKDKDRTMMGATPEQAAAALVEAGADVIGANCGQGIAGFVRICARLKSAAVGTSRLDQGQRRLAANAGGQGCLCHDGDGIRGPRSRRVGRRGEFHRRLLRHLTGIHPGNIPATSREIVLWLRFDYTSSPVRFSSGNWNCWQSVRKTKSRFSIWKWACTKAPVKISAPRFRARLMPCPPTGATPSPSATACAIVASSACRRERCR